jgi:hypothetical protein
MIPLAPPLERPLTQAKTASRYLETVAVTHLSPFSERVKL